MGQKSVGQPNVVCTFLLDRLGRILDVRHMVARSDEPVAEPTSEEPIAQVDRVTYEVTREGLRRDPGPDLLVREEPLEIRVNGAPVAVLMRTPGDDEALVRGFLLTERIVERSSDIRSIRPCRVVDLPEAEGNVFLAVLEPEVPFDLARFRRNLFATSSCGICGKASVEAALRTAPPVGDGPPMARPTALELVPAMRRAQPLFDRTGGLHAAAAFTADGRALAVHEDIGRHNAVDKVVGSLAAKGLAADALVVSGRVSFEIAQKALAARIPILIAVSAPSALAVELCRASNMTVAAFVRGERMVVYADPGRLIDAPKEMPS